MTLYRLIEESSFESALLTPKANSSRTFTTHDLTVNGLPARLAIGGSNSQAKWASDIAALTGHDETLTNIVPGAVLLIQDKTPTIWALTWGTGYHMLDAEHIDFSFGPGIVARSALPTELKSLTKTVLDHRARVDRSSTPNGSTLRDLGVDGYGEVVSRIEAKAKISGLTVGDKVIQLRAAESLNLPLARSPKALVKDLATIQAVSRQPILAGLEGLEQLVAIKPKNSLVPKLEKRLADTLTSGEATKLGMSWPHERLDIHGTVASVKVTGLGDHKRRVFEQIPDINQVIEWFKDTPPESVTSKLKKVRIELHSEAEPEVGTLISSAVPLRRWLAFEIEESNQRFCLHDGNWYRMDNQYLARIDSRISEILSKKPSLELPPWGSEHEAEYNARAASACGGYCLDRKLIRTELHSRGGIEPCDIFVPPGILIHVKRGRSSADLSHLLAQALVSADALARDDHARAAWKKRIADESKDVVQDAQLDEVILAIGQEQPVSVQSLFSFTKVNLVKQYDLLAYLGVKVRVTSV